MGRGCIDERFSFRRVGSSCCALDFFVVGVGAITSFAERESEAVVAFGFETELALLASLACDLRLVVSPCSRPVASLAIFSNTLPNPSSRNLRWIFSTAVSGIARGGVDELPLSDDRWIGELEDEFEDDSFR